MSDLLTRLLLALGGLALGVTFALRVLLCL